MRRSWNFSSPRSLSRIFSIFLRQLTRPNLPMKNLGYSLNTISIYLKSILVQVIILFCSLPVLVVCIAATQRISFTVKVNRLCRNTFLWKNKLTRKETTNTFFDDTFKTKIKEFFFSKTSQSPISVCLKKIAPKSQVKMKP